MEKLCIVLYKENGLSGAELQEKLKISERTRFRYLEELRSMGAEVYYEKITNKYRLQKEFSPIQFCRDKIL